MTTRLCFLIAVVAMISTSAFAVCLTEPTIINGVVQYDPDGTRKYASGFKDVWRNDLEKDFADYGLLFEDAKDRHCSLWATQSLRWKVEDTLARATNRTHTHKATWTNVGPYQNWLEGAHLTMILTAALQIGGHGDMSSALDAKIQSAITYFINNPNRPYGQNELGKCGIGTHWKDLGGTGDTCMDEHTVGAAAYAWIAAYQNKRGNFTSRNTNITSARTAINSAFSLDDSICLHDPNVGMSATGRGPCNVTDPNQIVSVLTRFSNPGWTYSFNRGQNQAYGFGLLASVSAALIGLEEADAPDIYGNAILKDSNGNPIAPVYLTDAQKKIAAALLKEAQRSSTPTTGEFFNGHIGGTGNCRNFGVNGANQVYWEDGKSCADSLQRARWYSLGGAAEPSVAPNTFFGKYIGVTPSTTVWDPQLNVTVYNAFTFNKFLWTDFVKNPATAGSAHWARAVWYGNLGYYWHTIHPNRNLFDGEPAAGQIRGRLAAQYDDHNPIGYIDGITAGGVAYGWTCDKDLPATSIAVDFYAGGIPGVGTYAGRTTALYSSEAAINTLCTGGTMHRFSAQLPASSKGQLIYPYGLDATWRGYTLLPPSTGCAGGYCSW